MTREFIMTPVFDKNWKSLRLTDDDLKAIQEYLLKNPGAGDMISGTGGLIKLRWSMFDKGKSGGVRTLYVDFMKQEKTIFVNCYGKSQKDSISDAEKAMYKNLISQIGKEL